MLRIFLAHAKEDEEAVIGLYNQLKQKGYQPWLDKEDLIAGQNWRAEIPKAIKDSQVFIACLSQCSIAKQGYVQREFKMALNEYANRPAGSIYLIPVRLDECLIPELRQEEFGINLRDIQWVDLFRIDGFQRLIRALEQGFPNAQHPLSSGQVHQLSVSVAPSQHSAVSSTSATTSPSILSTRISRRRVFQLLGLAGSGSAAILLRKALFQPGTFPFRAIRASPLTAADFAPLEFKTAIVNEKGDVINEEITKSKAFREKIGNISLDLMPIHGGSFMMGSPDGQGEDDEHPQHQVTVKPFLIGMYQVTQAQWRAVAALPKEKKQNLKANPSQFKGDNRPVEQVSWDDAVEFCMRLSKKSGRLYRLPSEAEWEYACRAGMTTPFHFGDTITTDLANYRGTDWIEDGVTYSGNYGQGPKGEFRGQTTNVGSFPANLFGLYDMHGNVWEWCQDDWHDNNYEGAPDDGSAWKIGDNAAQRLLRGGSYYFVPSYCRSAIRVSETRFSTDDNIGFRVVCETPWSLA